jgi:ADP-ribosyl-[dinitrogen reductase] hydrolase
MEIKSKIKGALYGFAIGDAMGATTEFMDEYQIKKKYNEVRDIIGGGWLNLEPGEVTDDTQMMMCVCEAIEHAHYSVFEDNEEFTRNVVLLDRCCSNFVNWYKSNPKDIGGCCSRVIRKSMGYGCYESWHTIAEDPESLGNGSLMRTMPIILAGLPRETAISQGRLTHNNLLCDTAIEIYYNNMVKLLYFNKLQSYAKELAEPTGHVLKTLNNSLYWTQHSKTFEDAIINAVNHGGDADTIAAVTGSMVGALYGYEAIPKRWIDQLKPDVKAELDKYSEFFTKLFEKNVKRVCTNTK